MLKLINTRILLSLITLIAAAAVIIGATNSFFSDSETSQNNTFTAGAIDLKIDNASYYNGLPNPDTSWSLNDLTNQLFFNFTDVKPSDIGEDTISFHADNDYWLCAKTTLTENSDNTCSDPELADDPTCDASPTATNSGELAQNINFIFWGDDGDNVLETNETVFKEGTAKDVLDNSSIVLADSVENNLGGADGTPASAGATMYVGKAWCFGTLTQTPVAQGQGVDPTVNGGVTCDGAAINNASQTDKVLANIQFTAVQARNNPDFTCDEKVIVSCEVNDAVFASSVVTNDQGLRKNATAVAATRSNPANAFGPNNTAGNDIDSPVEGTFFSLGFPNVSPSTASASLTLGFSEPFYNGPTSQDLFVYEVTGGLYPDEKVKIEASKDGLTWVLLSASAVRDEAVDLGSLDFANYVRLTDVSGAANFSDATADGYDVDAVKGFCTAKR